jgi:hypothetical protein
MNDHVHIEDPRVQAVLAAAAAPAEAPLPGEAAALAAYREVHPPIRRNRPMRIRENAKLLAAALFGGVVMASGVATAATGGGFLVSHDHTPKSHAPAVTQQDGDNEDATNDVEDSNADSNTADSNTADANTDNTNNDKGAAVSDLARTTDPGKGHGAAVCTLASAGKCQSGTHGQSDATTHGKAHQGQGQSGDTHGNPSDTTAPDTTSHKTLKSGNAGTHAHNHATGKPSDTSGDTQTDSGS